MIARLFKRHVIFVAFFIGIGHIQSQAYFQQQVNYTIQVSLDDSLHVLKAHEKITYVNHSPQTLQYIYFHLWPNAYQPGSHLDRQMLGNHKKELHYGKAEALGRIDSLSFTTGSKKLTWHFLKDTMDAAVVYLDAPLQPGDSVNIETPFYVKIPDASFSRLGHTMQAYFITQWYPKPAVFDKTGWHVMPYLNQGEFYSEFGNYEVKITLPANYVVAATGDRYDSEADEALMRERERQGLDAPVGSTLAFPPSDTVMKTITFRQKQVHDFAWFADKRFMVRMEEFELPISHRKVKAYAYFTALSKNLWKEGARFVKEAVLFYSTHVGEYPYNHASAVDGQIMAGGGMEYPNVTVINTPSGLYDLDVVIAHEVGHNWFYGILGNNERDDPFMDEGLNSFYEMRYVRQRYSKLTLANFVGQDASFKIMRLNEFPVWKEKELLYAMSMRSREEQPLTTGSEAYTDFNYGAIVYSKSPVIMDYLMRLVGPAQLDSAMQAYYQQWAFKHPTREDFLQALMTFLKTDLSWLNTYYLAGTGLPDYKLGRIQSKKDSLYTLVIKNRSKIVSPLLLNVMVNEKLWQQIKVDGFRGRKTISWRMPAAERLKVEIDEVVPDLFKSNNHSHLKFAKRQRKFQLNFGSAVEHPGYRRLYWLPLMGMNVYNGWMPGLVFHNYGLVSKRLQFYVAPFFGLKNFEPAGGAEITYARYFNKFLKQVTFGVRGRHYAYTRGLAEFQTPKTANYTRLSPSIVFDFKKKRANGNFKHQLSLVSHLIFIDSLNVINQALVIKKTRQSINVMNYEWMHTGMLQPWWLQIQAQQAGAMLKLQATYTLQIQLTSKKTMHIRAFAGSFISGTDAERKFYAFRGSGYSGLDDYTFVMNHLGRSERAGIAFAQFMEADGTLKVWAPMANSTQWMGAIGIKSPNWGMWRLYADAVVRSETPSKIQWYYDAGINLTFSKDFFEVYVPLIYSQAIDDYLDQSGISWAERIRFTMNIHKLVGSRLLKETLFN